ncbi:MAG: GTPase ObgE [Candidatus Moranbacteria bacterium]|nr:GTPase ObgE [Candidatus Moranbacteria bacterium]
MITDEVKIIVRAGRGGDGVASFDRAKMGLGPTGGKGGDGGNVFLEGVTDLTALNKYKQKREYFAGRGRNGKSDRSTGPGGRDLTLTIPAGSVVRNVKTGEEFEITKGGEKILVAKGGSGGRGNFLFRSAENTSPREFEEGYPGEEFEFFIELRLIADIGLVGLPNAGKSSLLNEITNANVKVANYAFTTLEPNLGVLGSLVIADIPGLIEGASLGKGLGVKFLKHIRRTKMLAHCLSLESENILKDYKTVRKELEDFSKELTKKKEIILLTKSDLASKEKIAKSKALMKKITPDVYPVSIHDWDSLQSLLKILSRQK